MPGGWLGRARLQSKLADVDGCQSDRWHADPLGSSCPLQAPPTAGISAPLIGFHDRRPAATARKNIDSRNPILEPRDTGIIANRAATVVNEVRVLTLRYNYSSSLRYFCPPCFAMTHERPLVFAFG